MLMVKSGGSTFSEIVQDDTVVFWEELIETVPSWMEFYLDQMMQSAPVGSIFEARSTTAGVVVDIWKPKADFVPEVIGGEPVHRTKMIPVFNGVIRLCRTDIMNMIANAD